MRVPSRSPQRTRPPQVSSRRAHLVKIEGSALLDFAVGPLDPREQGFDVGGLHRGAAPDAQAGRSVAVGAEVVADSFLVEQFHQSGDLVVGEVEGEADRGKECSHSSTKRSSSLTMP